MPNNPLLQPSPYEADNGQLIGRDPKSISADEYRAAYPDPVWGLKAVRAKCLDCADNAAEVRKCVVTACPLWPLRMGSVPKALKEATQ